MSTKSGRITDTRDVPFLLLERERDSSNVVDPTDVSGRGGGGGGNKQREIERKET